jgi:hypothetical protein
MSNDLTTPANRALATNVSPWREAANDEIGTNFGTSLKFTKGAIGPSVKKKRK